MHLRTSHRRALALGLSLALLVVLSGGLVVGMASASDTHRAQLNTSDTTNETSTASNGTTITDGVVLLDRSAGEGTASVTLRVEDPTSVTLSDGAMQNEGQIPTTTRVLSPGTHTVTLNVQNSPGRAVVLSTGDTGYYIPIQQPEGGDDATNPFARTPATAGWFGGAAAVMVMAALAAWHVKRDTLEEPEVME